MRNDFAQGFHEAMMLLKELTENGELTPIQKIEARFLVENYINAYEAGRMPFRMP